MTLTPLARLTGTLVPSNVNQCCLLTKCHLWLNVLSIRGTRKQCFPRLKKYSQVGYEQNTQSSIIINFLYIYNGTS